MSNLYMDDNDVLGELPGCDICYARHRTEKCRFSYTTMYTPKLVEFRKYLMCRKQAIDNNDEVYMLVGDFLPFDWDEDVKPAGDGPPLLNERVLAKYYKELAKLDPDDIKVGDYMYWDGFKQWGYYPFDEVIETDFSSPVEFDCGSIIQPEKIPTIVEELEVNDDLITNELIEDVEIIEGEINIQLADFSDCIEVDFVIKSDVEMKIYIVEFESDGMMKSYDEGGKIDVWLSNEEWIQAKRLKLGRASRAYFLDP